MAQSSNFENPFNSLGLDRQAVEALLESQDPEALRIALDGMKKVLAKALHPRTVDQKRSQFLETFLVEASRVTDMTDDQIGILAKAYTKSRRPRTPQQKSISYESKDLYDGNLLRAVADMVTVSGESIASVHNQAFIVRPLGYSQDKPQDTEAKPREWYPPITMRVPIISVGQDGKVSWQPTRQADLRRLLEKDLDRPVDDKQFKFYTDEINASIFNDLQPIEPQLRSITRKGLLMLKKTEEELIVGDINGKNALAVTIDSTNNSVTLKNGIYHFMNDYSEGHWQPKIRSTCYLPEGPAINQSDLLIMGSTSTDYVAMVQKTFTTSTTKRPALRTTGDNMSNLPSYTVPDNMLRYIERDYTPQVERGRHILATNSNSDVLILGTVAI